MHVLRAPTGRELQVLQGVAEQKTSKEIAREMGISPGTVEDKRKNILFKTGAKNMMGAVIVAIRQGWIAICLVASSIISPIDYQLPPRLPRTSQAPTRIFQLRASRRADDYLLPAAA